jgi:hypothetical protein
LSRRSGRRPPGERARCLVAASLALRRAGQ